MHAAILSPSSTLDGLIPQVETERPLKRSTAPEQRTFSRIQIGPAVEVISAAGEAYGGKNSKRTKQFRKFRAAGRRP